MQELLLHSKAIKPVSPEHLAELRRISTLDVSSYSEADVRAEIIDPVVRILGYQKETYFSLEREKHLKILDGDLFIDYRMTLWSEAFWLIEAKKVKRKAFKFNSSELQQALNYAAHPEINAALVVLCDGRIFEVYDREESVTTPVARVEVKNLPEQFNDLQVWLSPWQAWFFQKRRILRLIDKVLDREINPGRLDEFKQAVLRRIEGKRGKIIENWRTVHPITAHHDERAAELRGMPIQDLIEAEFFFDFSVGDMNLMAQLLAEKARPGGFDVLYRMFPDSPRDMNDNFVGAALRTLIAFDASGLKVNWLPDWLRGEGEDIDGVIKKLIRLGLNTFDEDSARKIVLQYSASARRVAKIAMARLPALTQVGQRNHELLRYYLEEIHQAQYMSSPEGHNIRTLDGIQIMMTDKLITMSHDDRKSFSTARAETALRDLWHTEQRFLGNGTEYWKSMKGRGIGGELNPTEYNWVTYDNLGHLVLCVIASSSKKWCEYIVDAHLPDIQRLAHYGSWQARKLLDIPDAVDLDSPTDEEMAQRFFYGDSKLFQNLRGGYRNRPH